MFADVHHFQQLSSCVGTNSCGVYFNTAPSDAGGLYFGATHFQGGFIPGGTTSNPVTEYIASNSWLADSNSTVTYDMATSNQACTLSSKYTHDVRVLFQFLLGMAAGPGLLLKYCSTSLVFVKTKRL